jgi:hypothetical protein
MSGSIRAASSRLNRWRDGGALVNILRAARSPDRHLERLLNRHPERSRGISSFKATGREMPRQFRHDRAAAPIAAKL